MRSGQLRHRIMIQEAVQTQSATGEVVNTWTDLQMVHAERIFKKLAPAMADGKGQEFVSMKVDFRIRIPRRFIPGPHHRVLLQGRIYEIQDTSWGREDNEEMYLHCETRSADGWKGLKP